MARYLYTLEVYDYESHDNYVIPLAKDASKLGDSKKDTKNYLTVIDQFIQNRYCQGGLSMHFANSDELKEYLNNNGYNFEGKIFASISYNADNEEKNLEVIYDDDAILKYFSLFFNNCNRQNLKPDEIVKELYKNKMWRLFVKSFLKLVKEKSFIDFIKSDLGHKYFTKYVYNYIIECFDNSNCLDYDQERAVKIAEGKLEDILVHYKQIRGTELAIKAYNKKYNLQASFLEEMAQESFEYLNKDYIKEMQLKELNNLPTHLTKKYTSGDALIDSYVGDTTGLSDFNEAIMEELGMSLEELSALPDAVKDNIKIDGISR